MKYAFLTLASILFTSITHAATLTCVASTGTGFQATATLQPARPHHAPLVTLSNVSVRSGGGAWTAIDGEGFAVLTDRNQVGYASVVDKKWNSVVAFVTNYGDRTKYSHSLGTFDARCTLSK